MNTGASDPTRGSARLRYPEAFRFAFSSDRPWETILLASLGFCIPLVGPLVVAGWQCEIMQRLVRGHPRPIPPLAFDDLRQYLSRGLTPFVVNALVATVGALITLGVFTGCGLLIALAAVLLRDSEAMLLVLLAALIGQLVVLVPILLMLLLLHVLLLRAELSEELRVTLGWPPVREYLQAHGWPILTSTLVVSFLYLAVGTLLLICCFPLILPLLVIGQLALLHLRWQIYEHHLALGGTAIPLKDAVVLPSAQRPRPAS